MRRPWPDTAPDAYAGRVLAILLEHFDLHDTTQTIVKDAVIRQRTAPNAAFEVIIDNPHSANWRLRPDLTNPRNVRLGDYRFPSRRGVLALNERVQAINAALRTLD